MIKYSSHIPILHLAMYCVIYVGDVTELMFTRACTRGQLFVKKYHSLIVLIY